MIVEVGVITGAKAFKLEMREGRLRAYIQSQPERNKANMELIKELSSRLGVPVRLVSGHSARRKRLEVPLDQADWDRFLSSI